MILPEISSSGNKEANVNNYNGSWAHFNTNDIDISMLNPSSIDSTIGDFKIDTDNPLPAFSNDFVDAYSVMLVNASITNPQNTVLLNNPDPAADITDQVTPITNDSTSNNDHYALVFKRNMPARLAELIYFKSIKSIITPQTFGLCQISSLGEGIYLAAIISKPKGRNLKELLASSIRLDENYILGKFLIPLLNILKHLHEQSITYGKLNLENIYIDSKGNITLGEFLSESCGYHQLSLYETTDRAQANKFGKGQGDEKVDYYALGITLFTLITGKDFHRIMPAEIIRLKLHQGTYDFLTKAAALPNKIANLIRNLVIDNPSQRWTFNEIEHYLKDKNFNSSTIFDKTYIARPIIFNGKDFFSRKALTYELSQNWELAKEFVKTDKIKKWLQLSPAEEPALELLESFNLHIVTGKVSSLKNFSSDDERLIRLLVVLDPEGPIRYKDLAFFREGIGLLLLTTFNLGQTDTSQVIVNMLISNIFSVYDYITTITENISFLSPSNQLYKHSDFINKTDVGFGIDRTLYELNPSLICQSSTLNKEFCINLKDTLYYLNNNLISFEDLSSKKSLACFIASRIGGSRSYKIKELEGFMLIQKSRSYQISNMLALAQKITKIGRLDHLTNILKDALKETLELHLKSISIKSQMLSNVESAAKSGIIADIVKAANAPRLIAKDVEGYTYAFKRCKEIASEIMSYNHRERYNSALRHKSLRVAVQFSYILCCFILVTIILRSL